MEVSQSEHANRPRRPLCTPRVDWQDFVQCIPLMGRGEILKLCMKEPERSSKISAGKRDFFMHCCTGMEMFCRVSDEKPVFHSKRSPALPTSSDGYG